MSWNTHIPKFRRFVLQNFPFIEEDFDALTDYQLICKVVEYLNKVITSQNEVVSELESFETNITNNFDKLEGLFVELKSYVDNYFNNLDVQAEINNKLDDMVEDGTLQEIITAYINSSALWMFDSVADMVSATNLVNGSYARTLGYHGKDDGGGATYIIREIQDGESADGGLLIDLNRDNLVAELNIPDNKVSVKQFGAYGDDTHDDTSAFNSAVAYVRSHYGKLYMDRGVYLLTSKITVDWNSGNFNLGFNQSFELYGAGQLETKLHFTSADGLDINPSNNPLVIKIHDFCLDNPDYVNLADSGNTRTPDLTHGVGLKVKHIGYMGRVSNISVRGFYVGIMSTNCYGGPVFENLFVKNTVFGYYSTSDTTIQHNSCSYVGCECCYYQNGSRCTLTNVICEANQQFFVTNENNQRSKFEGYGFKFVSANVVCNTCYTEDLYGNAVYIENSAFMDNLSTFNNFMHYHLTQVAYADLKEWLDENPGHNYDDIYVTLNSQNRNFVLFNGTQIVTTGTAYVDVYQGSTLLSETQSVEFRGMAQTGTYANNIARYQQGHTLPILSFNRAPSLNGSTIGFSPTKIYGTPEFCNTLAPTNTTGYNTIVATRKANFTDTSYDEVKLIVRQNLDGSIRIYRATHLEGSQVDMTEVIRISASNQVTFPANNS